ncbi:conserved hypothetical protein [Ricinus communis]|uniref:Uncharacterized protein n=1 Tax=Ricinus communis TaxID=3988 RepID=B9RP64_RICCO|nr:conserved hypothetical protein [Ricinus communis]
MMTRLFASSDFLFSRSPVLLKQRNVMVTTKIHSHRDAVHQWTKRACQGGSIVVEVVDFCSINPCPATMVVSNKAFDAIARIPTAKINISNIYSNHLLSLNYANHSTDCRNTRGTKFDAGVCVSSCALGQ